MYHVSKISNVFFIFLITQSKMMEEVCFSPVMGN